MSPAPSAMTPSLLDLPEGCAFRERCPRADEACHATPGMTALSGNRQVRCFHPHDEATG